MRELLDDIYRNQPLDPVQAARSNLRPKQRRRFYKEADVAAAAEGGFAVRLDGRGIRTPAGKVLAAPLRPLAEAIAGEWSAQGEAIDPSQMPLTRLANSIIDGVAAVRQDVVEDVARYLGSDLLLYRAAEPEGLVAAQTRHWDAVLDWAFATHGARFILAEGIVHVAQPERALAAMRRAIPADVWQLGAVHSVTSLTGSALLALALSGRRLAAAEAWAAAHVDEDWNMAQWGCDEAAMQRRAARWEEMRAAAAVLDCFAA